MALIVLNLFSLKSFKDIIAIFILRRDDMNQDKFIAFFKDDNLEREGIGLEYENDLATVKFYLNGQFITVIAYYRNVVNDGNPDENIPDHDIELDEAYVTIEEISLNDEDNIEVQEFLGWEETVRPILIDKLFTYSIKTR